MSNAIRWFVISLLGLITGIVLAGALQTGTSFIRYEVDTPWLDQTVLPFYLLGAGLLAAALLSVPLAYAQARELHRIAGPADQSRTGRLAAAIGVAFLLDPYFLAYIGMTFAPNWQWELRGIAVALIVFAQTDVMGEAGRTRNVWLLTGGVAMLVHLLLPRYFGVPVLPDTLEIASQSPVHILVFARAIILVLIANAASLLILNRKTGTVVQ